MKPLILLSLLLTIPIATQAQDAKWKATCLAGAEYQFEGGKIRTCPRRDFWRPFGPAFKVSSAAYWSAVFADMANTNKLVGTGGYAELNPFLRSRSGGLSTPKYLAYNAAIYGGTIWLERKSPKKAFWIRIAHSAIHAGVVAASRKMEDSHE